MPKVLLIIAVALAFAVVAYLLLRSGRSRELVDTPVPDLPDELKAQVALLVNRRQKLQAIKLVVDATGWKVGAAKAAVEAVERSPERWTVEPDPLAGLSPTVRAELDELVAGDRKVQAVKLVRQHTGLTLVEAKQLVDRL